MAREEALVLLRMWFGSREFLVRQMTDAQIEEVAESLGIREPELRSKVGRWFSNRRLECELGTNKRLSLVVVSQAAGGTPAVYQVQETRLDVKYPSIWHRFLSKSKKIFQAFRVL